MVKYVISETIDYWVNVCYVIPMTNSKMTFHEYYGDVTVAQLRAYKKYNVSQSDHDDLVRVYGEDNHDLITKAVVACSPNGYFNPYHLAMTLR